MNTEDIDAAVELIEESSFSSNAAKALQSLTSKVGNLDRERHKEISAAAFLRAMQRLGYTFIWEDGPNGGNKYSDVFQALAATMPEFDEKSLIEKSEHVQEYGPRLRAGFYAARKWLDKWYEETVFCVPRHTESGVLTVITLNRDFHLGDGTPAALTAAQMQQLRDEKLATGQVSASAKRMSAATKDKGAVRTRINAIVDKALVDLDTHKGSRLIEEQSQA